MDDRAFVSYIKSKSGLSKVFDAWVKRYETMEYLGGSIQLDQLSIQECEDIGSFLQSFIRPPKLKITYVKMRKAIQSSRFSECDFIEILKLYKGEEFYFKRSEVQQTNAQFFTFCETCLKQNNGKPASVWLTYVLHTSGGERTKWKALWTTDKRACFMIIDAINAFPIWEQKLQLIAEFAQEFTKDPHYFDKGLPHYILFHAIYIIFQHGEEPKSTVEKAQCLLRAGLIKDDTSNFCIVCHLRAFHNETAHMAWDAFYDSYEPWMVNVYNIQNVTRIIGDERTYIVENPSTFRILSLFVKEHSLRVSVICTYGQPNLCAYLLLDKLYESKCKMYYAGDFDPEGIMIADTLKQRYPSLILWHYAPSDYECAISNKTIGDKRLKMLSKCVDEDLKGLCEKVLNKRVAGYQESLHGLYKVDLLQQ